MPTLIVKYVVSGGPWNLTYEYSSQSSAPFDVFSRSLAVKILQLAPRLPFPLTDGGAIGIYNITKHLAQLGHEITLATYPLESKELTENARRDMGQFCDLRLISHPLPSRARTLSRTLFKGAYPIERRMTPEMFELIAKIIAEKQFDIVHVDHAHMGRYGLWIKKTFGIPVVLREHNFESLIYERYSSTEANLLKKALARMHGRRLRKEELRFISGFDAVAAITEEDARLMRSATDRKDISVIPAGVDCEFFTPSTSLPLPNRLLTVGALSWDPNLDATRYFLNEIFPLILAEIPTVTLDVVGEESEKVGSLAGRFSASVNLHGKVPDVRDFLSHSTVLVVPLRIGGGMRLKLLEFFASGKAVVSTSIGSEGNLAENGIQLLIRDDPKSFAASVVELLRNATLRASLGKNARLLVESHYSWSKIASDFTKLYEEVLQMSRFN